MSLLDGIKKFLAPRPETPKPSVGAAPTAEPRQSASSPPVVEPSNTRQPSNEPQKAADSAAEEVGLAATTTRPSQPEKTASIEAMCPHCGHALEKRPMRKTQCPNCGNHIYVKSTPTGQTEMLLTEQQAAEVEKQWRRYHEEKELENLLNSDPEYRQEYERTNAELKAKWGLEPSVKDTRWAVAGRRLLRYAKRGDWGLYRNTRMQMAKQLQLEKKLKHALRTYLEVCYLDVNGPNNLGGYRSKEFPPFDPITGWLAPGIISEVRELTHSLGLQADELKALFMGIAVPNHENLRLPIDPAQGWDKIAQTNIFATEKEMEAERIAHGSGYDLLSIAEDRMKTLESSGAGFEQYVEILSMLEAALARGISPNTQAIVHKRIGEIQHKFGRDVDAIHHFETAIKLNPKVGVKKLLHSLQKQRPTSPL